MEGVRGRQLTFAVPEGPTTLTVSNSARYSELSANYTLPARPRAEIRPILECLSSASLGPYLWSYEFPVSPECLIHQIKQFRKCHAEHLSGGHNAMYAQSG